MKLKCCRSIALSIPMIQMIIAIKNDEVTNITIVCVIAITWAMTRAIAIMYRRTLDTEKAFLDKKNFDIIVVILCMFLSVPNHVLWLIYPVIYFLLEKEILRKIF